MILVGSNRRPSTSRGRPAAPKRVALALLVAGLLAAPGSAQTDRLCGNCKTTGRVEAEVAKKFAVESEHGATWKVLFCADAIESDNMALDWEPCTRCKGSTEQVAAQADWDAIQAKNQAWLAERRRVDALVDAKQVSHVETTHFIITWNVPKISVDRKSFRMHEAAHLYAQRMEEFYAKLQSLLGIEDSNNIRNKHFIYVFETVTEARIAGPVYAGLSGNLTVKRAGGASHESVIVTWLNKAEQSTDEDFHRHLIHSMTHQLTSIYYDVKWFPQGELGLLPPWLNDKYGWLDAGLAHWFEMDFDGEADTFCFREQDRTQRWKGSDWKRNVWKSVMAEDLVSFPEVAVKPTQALSPQEHQFVWSWIDYLMTRGTLEMGQMVKLAKQDKAARDLLKEAYGLSSLRFETDWAEWVKTEYAPSNKEGRVDRRVVPDR